MADKIIKDAEKYKDFYSWVNSFPFERACREDVTDPRTGCLAEFSGEAGRGVYAYPAKSTPMRNYYNDNTVKDVVKIKFTQGRPVDLTKETQQLIAHLKRYQDKLAKNIGPGFIKRPITRDNYHRNCYGIMEYVKQNHPNAPGYLIQHRGPGLPTDKQLVITKPDQILFVPESPMKKIWDKVKK